MNILILPGASDPCEKKSTELIKSYAQARKFEKIECISYPGHKSYNQSNGVDKKLKYPSTKKIMTEALHRFNSYQEAFIVFVRSYGCNPYLDILANESLDLGYLKKSIVWGSSSYHFIFKVATEQFGDYYKNGLRKGVTMSKKIIKGNYPVENYVQGQTNFKVKFCSGADDPYVPPYFYQYLESLNENKNNSFPCLIKGEGHTVEQKNEDYERLIFE